MFLSPRDRDHRTPHGTARTCQRRNPHWIEIHTDPKNAEYVVVEGAQRIGETTRSAAELGVESLTDPKELEKSKPVIAIGCLQRLCTWAHAWAATRAVWLAGGVGSGGARARGPRVVCGRAAWGDRLIASLPARRSCGR